MRFKRQVSGVTLVEVLLVMVVISSIIYMGVGYMQQKALHARIDRTSVQMQQILNAGLAYYVGQGAWPTFPQPWKPDSVSNCLLGKGGEGCAIPYLPSAAFIPPWAQSDVYYYASTEQAFFVWMKFRPPVSATSIAAAEMISGMLPGGYTTNNADGEPEGSPPKGGACSAGGCSVVGTVTIPGQNLNNATSVNFAGLYHHGACVPVPTCPANMAPRIMVVPVRASGVSDNDSTTPTKDKSDVYPISSFAAYATGGTDTLPPDCSIEQGVPKETKYSTSNDCSVEGENNGAPASKYWRACMQLITQKGDVQVTRDDLWGKYVTVMAITRCAIKNEPAGSTWSVYSN